MRHPGCPWLLSLVRELDGPFTKQRSTQTSIHFHFGSRLGRSLSSSPDNVGSAVHTSFSHALKLGHFKISQSHLNVFIGNHLNFIDLLVALKY